MRVCILGSGSSALAAAWGLLAGVDEQKPTSDLKLSLIDFSGNPTNKDGGPLSRSNPTGKPSSDGVFNIPSIFQTESKLFGGFSGSSSFGGLATIWGATLLEYPLKYLALWGESQGEMEKAYSEMLSRIPNLQSEGTNNSVEPNLEITRVPCGLHKNAGIPSPGQKLSESFGVREWSRLAISPISRDQRSGCNQCGECLSGCPAGHIWRPDKVWSSVFSSNAAVVYHGSEWVESVSEMGGSVTVKTQTENLGPRARTFDKVLVALGPIQTAALLLRSGLTREKEVSISDSQMFMVPFVLKSLRKTSSDGQKRITLSDVFAYSNPEEEELGEDWFAQLYGNSSQLNDAVRSRVWALRILPKKILSIVMQRIGMAMIFLPGKTSGRINVKILDNEEIRVSPVANASSRGKLAAARSGLRKMGFIPILGFSKETPVGLGYHSGASFPMVDSYEPRANHSDHLGRPNGTDAIHVVDSSVLPALASRPVTFSTMANAFRIAKEIAIGSQNEKI